MPWVKLVHLRSPPRPGKSPAQTIKCGMARISGEVAMAVPPLKATPRPGSSISHRGRASIPPRRSGGRSVLRLGQALLDESDELVGLDEALGHSVGRRRL